MIEFANNEINHRSRRCLIVRGGEREREGDERDSRHCTVSDDSRPLKHPKLDPSDRPTGRPTERCRIEQGGDSTGGRAPCALLGGGRRRHRRSGRPGRSLRGLRPPRRPPVRPIRFGPFFSRPRAVQLCPFGGLNNVSNLLVKCLPAPRSIYRAF